VSKFVVGSHYANQSPRVRNFTLANFKYFAVIRQAPTTTMSPMQRDPQALTILQSALIALGGAAQTASIVASSTRTQFLADSTTVSLPWRVEVFGYDRFRSEVDTPDHCTLVTVVSGTISSHYFSVEGVHPALVAPLQRGSNLEAPSCSRHAEVCNFSAHFLYTGKPVSTRTPAVEAST